MCQDVVVLFYCVDIRFVFSSLQVLVCPFGIMESQAQADSPAHSPSESLPPEPPAEEVEGDLMGRYLVFNFSFPPPPFITGRPRELACQAP